MSVTAILVSFNSSRVLPDAIRSLAAQPEITRIVVVDNASADGSCDLVAQQFPHAQIIRSEENLGFGRANNLALESVTTPYALLVNPDAALGTDCVRNLLDVMAQYPECAIAAPALKDANGKSLETYKKKCIRTGKT